MRISRLEYRPDGAVSNRISSGSSPSCQRMRASIRVVRSSPGAGVADRAHRVRAEVDLVERAIRRGATRHVLVALEPEGQAAGAAAAVVAGAGVRIVDRRRSRARRQHGNRSDDPQSPHAHHRCKQGTIEPSVATES